MAVFGTLYRKKQPVQPVRLGWFSNVAMRSTLYIFVQVRLPGHLYSCALITVAIAGITVRAPASALKRYPFTQLSP